MSLKIYWWADPIRYNCGDAPGFDLSDWTNVKFKLGLDFPNLPYLIDGNIKVTQSNAILRYLGRKFGLDGKTEADKVNKFILFFLWGIQQ